MSRGFADIAFTPAVQEFQTRYGSRKMLAKWSDHDRSRDLITQRESSFIAARDGFYQASVNTDGWPYVQFRGGPAGFLKVLDESTLAYADFRGNVQYISAGNISESNKVSIILMDYANQRRLKILARAEIVEMDDNPELIEKLQDPSYAAKVERAVVLKVEGLNWNCPQHITPRFTLPEIEEYILPQLQQT